MTPVPRITAPHSNGAEALSVTRCANHRGDRDAGTRASVSEDERRADDVSEAVASNSLTTGSRDLLTYARVVTAIKVAPVRRHVGTRGVVVRTGA